MVLVETILERRLSLSLAWGEEDEGGGGGGKYFVEEASLSHNEGGEWMEVVVVVESIR